MHFCPCSCDDPIDPETEENELFSLPRNLSYVQDSYLDRYSVSASFVHNPKIERYIQHQQGQEWRAKVEDETLGLLSAITAQELHGRCDGIFESVTSSGFIFSHSDSATGSVFSHSDSATGSVFSHPNTSREFVFSHPDTSREFVFSQPDIATGSVFSKTSSQPSSTWSVTHSSAFSASSLLHPASLVASKISAFLHSPPNESMDSARDLGTSVDADSLPIPLQTDNLARMDPLSVEYADSSLEEINRVDSGKLHAPIHSAEGDTEQHDGLLPGVNNCIGVSNISDNCDVAMAEGTVTYNQLVIESKDQNQVAITEDTGAHNQVVTESKTNLNDVPKEDTAGVKVSTYLSAFCESSEHSTREELDVGEKTGFPEADVSMDGEDSHRISDITHGSSPPRPADYPAVRSLDVDIKIYIPPRDIALNIVKEDEDRIIQGSASSTSYGSPDSDAFSEEGVFVNIDDLDSTNEKSTTVSDASDDTCVSVDSMFLSPEEGELEEGGDQEPARKMTLEEAINRAATDLTKMSLELYGNLAASLTSNTSSTTSLLDVEEDLRFSSLSMKTAGRTSPVRGSKALKLTISDHSDTETENNIRDSTATLSESPIYTDQEFNFSRVQLRKSSSLKTNKTPPGTPHRKKVVRFADAMGLDLESVRHVLNMESPPKIPPSALADLVKGLDEDIKDIGSRYLCPCFSQPGAADNFFHKVRNQKVSLENAIINDLTITGIVRVANISYHKSVRIRYTHNSWSSFYDIAASYIQNSCDGPTDRFSFSIVAPPFFGPGSRLEFAVCFIADGLEYWDNNDGKNYVFECFAKSVPTDSETAWLHFL